MDALVRFKNPTTDRIGRFLESVGLTVQAGEVPEGSILPGIRIEDGALVVDEARLLYPGDLLHEAGHLAVLTAEQRAGQGANAGDDLGNEIGAMCWSYAAVLHLQLDPALVFHPYGYRGASESYLENFREGRYPGVPLLQWMGLTADEKRAPALGVEPYPHMLRWLRE
ncbi:MAG TPA: hypothetical protein VHU83_00800 [Bryobacteraceae bacterium]|jgi:hypothetical protein|nr:hypothetical protein [Bryobacteraceae bacterium]